MEKGDNFYENKVGPRSSYDVKEDLELDDEEKMEKFYELIRRFSTARDYQRSVLQAHQKRDQDHAHDHGRPSWVPSFKWEDFRNVHDVKISRINHDHHVGVAAPDRAPPPPTGPGVRCPNPVQVYINDEHCHEKKKKRKMVDCNCSDEEREKRKIEPENNVTGLDLNLAL